jgi:hypothetical protein
MYCLLVLSPIKKIGIPPIEKIKVLLYHAIRKRGGKAMWITVLKTGGLTALNKYCRKYLRIKYENNLYSQVFFCTPMSSKKAFLREKAPNELGEYSGNLKEPTHEKMLPIHS